MADNLIDRLGVEIVGDSKDYNTSLDGAIARTKTMISRQKELTQSLERNQTAQEKTGKKIETATRRYGENSTEVAKLKEKLENLKNAERQMQSEIDKANKSLASQGKHFENLGRKGSDFANAFKAILTGYAGKTFLEATIGGVSQFEQYQASFSVLLGDMEKGRAKLEEIQKMASVTPFELEDLAKASQMLLGYGITAEELLPTLTKLGDLSQGNAERLDRVALAYGQMVAKQKVTGEELRQMTEAQVPLLKALQDTLGVTGEEYENLQRQGLVSIQDLNNAIDYLATGTGDFAGMMEKHSQTLAGLYSTVKDNVKAVSREIGSEAFQVVKGDLKEFMNEFDRMKQSGELTTLAKGWGSAFANITGAITGTTLAMAKNREMTGLLITAYGSLKIVQQVTTAMEAYRTAVKTATTAQALLNATMSVNPLTLLIGALATVTGGILAFSNATDGATKKVKELNEETAKINANEYNFGSEKVSELQRIATYTVPEIEKLGKEIDNLGGYSELSAGKQQLLQEKISDVNGVMGEEAVRIDEHTGRLVINTQELYNNIEALEKRAKAEGAYQSLVQKEREFMEFSLEYERKKEQFEKDSSKRLEGNTQQQLSQIYKSAGLEKEFKAMEKEYNAMQENIDSVRNKTEELFKDLGETVPSKTAETAKKSAEAISPPVVKATKDTTKKVEDVLKKSYDEQLKISNDFLNKQKQTINEEYSARVKSINESHKRRLKAINDDYKAEKDRVNKIIKELDREIEAKRRGREEEKRDREKELLTQQMQTLEQRIDFARTPEEKAELEKELKRQQEQMKDIQLEEQVQALEDEKTKQQDRLEKINERHEREVELLEERKERQLKNLEEEKDRAIKNIEEATLVMRKRLSDIYGYIDNETISTGERFANVTVDSLDKGFTTVAGEAQNTIDIMMAKVENAISRLRRAISDAEDARSTVKRQKSKSSRSYTDSRSFVANNYITSGMTEQQANSMLTRQSNSFLYGRG